MAKRLALVAILSLVFIGCPRRDIEMEEAEIVVIPPVEDTIPQEQDTLPPEPELTPAQIREIVSAELSRIHFDFDRYEIRPGDARILERNAEILKAHPDVRIRIEGHCDERGTSEYNLALGERRAIAVRNYLVRLGIERERISIKSYGEERPLDPGKNESAWAKNRRAESVVVE